MKQVYKLLGLFIFIQCSTTEEQIVKDKLALEKLNTDQDPINVVYILSDDHRYDFMGFTGKVPFLETPNMDRMAGEGAHMKNAFVTTSLCSPSRASILTGQFSHRHGVVDNQSLVPDSAVFFPEYLQKAGYSTGFIGKWHMGAHHYDKRPGFDYWASFRGQGKYYNPTFNVNGKERAYTDSSYVTDLITDFSLEFLKQQKNSDKPFLLYTSHKGVHAQFKPAKRHSGKYENETPAYPPTMFLPGENPHGTDTIGYNYEDVPDWVKEQRHSWHGVDYMYHGQIGFEAFYRRYSETLLSVDESIGSIIEYLEANDMMENTVIFYMGDNGFSFGEHGLIDKRQAYQESIRVPLLAFGSGIQPGTIVEQMVQNIDIAPTILEIAGLKSPLNMDGRSFKPLLEGKNPSDWRKRVYYEYYWERPFPQTPTTFAVVTNQYKFIRYYGIWDINELYDIKNDPFEANNLIRNSDYDSIANRLNRDLWKWQERTDGMQIPLKKALFKKFDHRYRDTY
ncbi:MAG TPA: sulfatase [Cyclobacteriaceae bacterium]